MRLELTGRHVEITPALRRLVDRKLARLLRRLNDGLMSVQVVLTREKRRQCVEITLHARGDKFLHSTAEGPGWEASLGEAVQKIDRQVRKVKGKWQERKRRAVPPRALPVPEAPGAARDTRPRVVKASSHEIKPMTVEDAALEVESGPAAFVVFRNADTDSINVLYRRRNGDLALIEPADL